MTGERTLRVPEVLARAHRTPSLDAGPDGQSRLGEPTQREGWRWMIR